MVHIVVDVESDGPIPGKYSMVSFGAVIVEPTLSKTFYGKCSPISLEWIPEALAISKHSRTECLSFPDPGVTMKAFAEWIQENSPGQRPVFWSDNNGYDFAFISYYFHMYYGSNPFGWSSNNIKSFAKGIYKKPNVNFRSMKKTKHTHHPVDDAMGYAEIMLELNTRHKLWFV